MSKEIATEEDIRAFIKAVYGSDNIDLILSMFNEKTVLKQATNQITSLKKRIGELETLAKVDAAARAELEAALAPSAFNIIRSICAHCDYVLPGDEPYLLREHLKTCEKHPMRALEKRIEELEKVLRSAGHALRSYQYGNSSDALAKDIADQIDKVTP